MLIKQKIKILIFLMLLISSLSSADKDNEKEFIVSNNGNFLFYNSPVVAKMNGNIFVAFLNNNGGIVVNKYENDNVSQTINSYFIHNYVNEINYVNKRIKKISKADDHASPEIIYDNDNNRLI